MYKLLADHRQRPQPFARFNSSRLWTDIHISRRMLALHLDPESELASRPQHQIDRIVAWLDAELGLKDKEVLDLGCGPGLYAARMADRGAVVTGVDFSESSVAYARQTHQGDGLTFTCGDYLRDPLPGGIEIATLIYGDICALPPDQRGRLFRRIRELLRPGGVLVLDAFSEEQFRQRRESATYDSELMDGFWAAEPYFGFATTFLYPELMLALDRYLIVENDRSWEVFNWLQYFTPQILGSELVDAGFSVRPPLDMVSGNAWQGGSREFALIAEAG